MAWELRESEERYRTLAETFGDLLVLRDGNGKITYCNQAYCALLETGKNKILERQLLPREISQLLEDAQNGSALQSERGTEITVSTSNGNRWFHWLDLPVRDERTGKTGTLSLARDITVFRNIADAEAQARQKAEQATRAKSRFLAMVSHEMRTPLNGILGMSKLLADTGLDKEQANYVKALSHSGASLLGLINDMLDMTMIEAGRFSLNKREFSPAEIVRETGELLSQKAHEKDIEFAIRTDDASETRIISDPDRFRQVLTNLVGNAVKFTRAGGVSIHCRTEHIPRSSKTNLVIEVSDTGPGINQEDAARIFSEFERIDNEATRKVDGAGLGLAIARALAIQLGGTLVLAETGRNGSVFRFELPLTISNGKAVPKSDLAKQLPDSSGKHIGNVLIISRNSMEAKALASMLADLGIKTEIIRTISALEKAIKNGTDNWAHVLFDPDKWQDAPAMEKRLQKHFSSCAALTILKRPGEVGAMKEGRGNPGTSWLVRPVRPASLRSVITGGNHCVVNAPLLQTPEPSMESPMDETAILLAEDNDINALLVTAALTRHAISVDRARDGREAVEMFKASQSGTNPHNYGLVLMDMQMPVMGGIEAIKAIREVERANGRERANIHVLSADEQKSSRHAAESAGADGFLVKPVEPSTLVDLAKAVHAGANAK